MLPSGRRAAAASAPGPSGWPPASDENRLARPAQPGHAQPDRRVRERCGHAIHHAFDAARDPVRYRPDDQDRRPFLPFCLQIIPPHRKCSPLPVRLCCANTSGCPGPQSPRLLDLRPPCRDSAPSYSTLMHRYAFRIEYNGAPFAGWQRQATQPSVQAAVERALARIDPAPTPSPPPDAPTRAFTPRAGRPCRPCPRMDPFRLMARSITTCAPIPSPSPPAPPCRPTGTPAFQPSNGATPTTSWRRRAPLVLDAGLAWRVPHDLALAPMQQAARHLLGRHDFTTFRAAECQADSPLRTLDEATVTAHPFPAGPRSTLPSAPGPSCTARCAAWSAHSNASARGHGTRTTSPRPSPPATAPPVARLPA